MHAHYQQPPADLGCPRCGTNERVLTWIMCPDGRLLSWLCDRCWLFAQVRIQEMGDGILGVTKDTVIEEVLREHRKRKKSYRDV